MDERGWFEKWPFFCSFFFRPSSLTRRVLASPQPPFGTKEASGEERSVKCIPGQEWIGQQPVRYRYSYSRKITSRVLRSKVERAFLGKWSISNWPLPNPLRISTSRATSKKKNLITKLRRRRQRESKKSIRYTCATLFYQFLYHPNDKIFSSFENVNGKAINFAVSCWAWTMSILFSFNLYNFPTLKRSNKLK